MMSMHYDSWLEWGVANSGLDLLSDSSTSLPLTMFSEMPTYILVLINTVKFLQVANIVSFLKEVHIWIWLIQYFFKKGSLKLQKLSFTIFTWCWCRINIRSNLLQNISSNFFKKFKTDALLKNMGSTILRSAGTGRPVHLHCIHVHLGCCCTSAGQGETFSITKEKAEGISAFSHY